MIDKIKPIALFAAAIISIFIFTEIDIHIIQAYLNDL